MGKLTYIKDGSCNDVTNNTSHIGYINPIRYRGYYYDVETGLYYVSSRYYDPEVCRFINADVYVSTGQELVGNNMLAYCNNNPVNKLDKDGQKPGDLFDSELEAVYDFAYCYLDKSKNENVEYGTDIISMTRTTAKLKWKKIGFIKLPYIKWGKEVKYTYSEPNKGNSRGVLCNGTYIPGCAQGINGGGVYYEVVAAVHTHADYNGNQDNFFSRADMIYSEWILRKPFYLVTPLGIVRRWDKTYKDDKGEYITQLEGFNPYIK